MQQPLSVNSSPEQAVSSMSSPNTLDAAETVQSGQSQTGSGVINSLSLIRTNDLDENESDSLNASSIEFNDSTSDIGADVNPTAASNEGRVNIGSQTRYTWVDDLRLISDVELENKTNDRKGTTINPRQDARAAVSENYRNPKVQHLLPAHDDYFRLAYRAHMNQHSVTAATYGYNIQPEHLKPQMRASLYSQTSGVKQSTPLNAKDIKPMINRLHDDFVRVINRPINTNSRSNAYPSYAPFLNSQAYSRSAAYKSSSEYRTQYLNQRLYTTLYWQERLQRRDMTSVLHRLI